MHCFNSYVIIILKVKNGIILDENAIDKKSTVV